MKKATLNVFTMENKKPHGVREVKKSSAYSLIVISLINCI